MLYISNKTICIRGIYMKTLDMHNLEESLSTHEQMYRHFQLFHKMHNQLPMGYPTELIQSVGCILQDRAKI